MTTSLMASISADIKTRAIEQTMAPLVDQVNSLLRLKEKLTLTDKSERQLKAVMGVGENLYNAIDKFVSLGNQIASENEDIREEMTNLCKQVSTAGEAIRDITSYRTIECSGTTTGILKPARTLLTYVSRVLILADKLTILRILAQVDQVRSYLNNIERIPSFSDFIKSFSDFGQSMVLLARISGERQAELLREEDRNQVIFVRSSLEKLTGLLLTACKVALRHPDDDFAMEMKAQTFTMIREALTSLSNLMSGSHSPQPAANAVNLLEQLLELLEMSKVLVSDPTVSEKLSLTFDLVEELSHDFTDSAYIEHENREDLIITAERCRHQLNHMVRLAITSECPTAATNAEYEKVLLKCTADVKVLKKQLEDVAYNSGLFSDLKVHDVMLEAILDSALEGDEESVSERCIQFHELADQVIEVCKMLEHVTSEEPIRVRIKNTSNFLSSLRPNVSLASRILTRFPSSKISREHFRLVCESWRSTMEDLSLLSDRLMWLRRRGDPEGWSQSLPVDQAKYCSLPRPGEQARIEQLGQDMKVTTSEMDSEASKWGNSNNTLVIRAKNMSDMAYAMYQFTRGEGALASTQDLFTQAQYFGEECNRLFLLVKDFSHQVPNEESKVHLLAALERLPPLCQRLLGTLRRPASGKTGVFAKVDTVLQEVKTLTTLVVKVVGCAFVCFRKYNVEFTRDMPTTPIKSRTLPRWDPNLYSDRPLNSRRSNSLTGHNGLLG